MTFTGHALAVTIQRVERGHLGRCRARVLAAARAERRAFDAFVALAGASAARLAHPIAKLQCSRKRARAKERAAQLRQFKAAQARLKHEEKMKAMMRCVSASGRAFGLILVPCALASR